MSVYKLSRYKAYHSIEMFQWDPAGLNGWPGWCGATPAVAPDVFRQACSAVSVVAVEICQGTRRETLSRRATGWMAATA